MLTKRPTLTKHFYLRHSFNKKYDGNCELMHYLSCLVRIGRLKFHPGKPQSWNHLLTMEN